MVRAGHQHHVTRDWDGHGSVGEREANKVAKAFTIVKTTVKGLGTIILIILTVAVGLMMTSVLLGST